MVTCCLLTLYFFYYTTYNNDKTQHEFTISKKKWICFSMYRPPKATNID